MTAAKKRALLAAYVRAAHGLSLDVERCEFGDFRHADDCAVHFAPADALEGDEESLAEYENDPLRACDCCRLTCLAPLPGVRDDSGKLRLCTKAAGEARRKCQGPGRPRELGATIDLEEYLRCYAVAAIGGPEVGREAWA